MTGRAGSAPQDGADRAGLDTLLRDLVARACGIDAEEIDADRPLAEYGLSSRDAVGIAGELEETLGRVLPATLLWEETTLAALADRLAREGAGSAQPAGQPAGGTGGAAPDSGLPAVVGIGCRLPGGVHGPDAFWEFLLGNGDAVGEVPSGRWAAWGERTEEAAAGLPATVRRGAYLDDVAAFDARFFGIAPREAELMDPQQRLVLEVACEALQHAGMPAPTLRGSATGVYVGLSATEYALLTTADPAAVTEWTATGSAASIVANRLSYTLDLHGPSITVDTACSSSLVALHQAARALRAGECDVALVAGVNVLLSPVVGAGFAEAGVLAPGGRCRPFDAAADGIVRGEGCGVVVLKRLADAEADGHRVLAVVRGTAVNSDGRSAGLVAPNPHAQQALLRAALRDAGTAAAEVDYVETHGTGTLLGDPIEAGALAGVLGSGRPTDRPLLIGSVKSNLGHLEGAAGITGLIKTVLALHRRRLPATLHFRRPNPHIDFAAGGLRVVDRPTPWPATNGRPARAGVSAFGFGGTNAHVVLEGWTGDGDTLPGAEDAGDASADPGEGDGTPHILVVSERSERRVADSARALADWLSAPQRTVSPTDLAHTLATNRSGDFAGAVVGRSTEELAAGLRALAEQRAANGVVLPRKAAVPAATTAAEPVFVFSGHGSQWAAMGARLLADDPAFATAVHDLDPVYAEATGKPLGTLLVQGAGPDDVARVQPLLFGLQVALARTLQTYGVEPAAVVGHSLGEVAAAVVAGALTPAQGLRVVLRRATLLATVDAQRLGAMAAVELPLDERSTVLGRYPGVGVAVDSSPMRCTVAGPAGAVGSLVADLEERGMTGRVLDVGGAGHSAAVDGVLADLRADLADLTAEAPHLPWYSTVYDDPRSVPRADADHWCANARRPVRLRQAVAAAAEDGHRVFVEVSPHPVAALPVHETLATAGAEDFLVLSTLRRDTEEAVALHTTLGELHLAGVQRAGERLWPAGRRVPLPAPPWRHDRYWADRRIRDDADRGRPLLGVRADVPGSGRVVWRGNVGTKGWCRVEKRVHGTAVMPLAVCAEMFLCAATEAFGVPLDAVVIRDMALDRLLPLADSTPVTTLLEPEGPGRAALRIFTRSPVGTWLRHASAVVEIAREEPAPAAAGALTVDVGPALPPQGVAAPWQFPPALLDACLNAPAGAGRVAQEAMPVALACLRARRPVPAGAVCRTWPAESPGAGGSRSTWSVRLEDAAGAPLLAADGVGLRVPDPSELPLPLEEKAYAVIWEPAGQEGPDVPAASDVLVLCSPQPFPPPSGRRLLDRLAAAGLRVTLTRGEPLSWARSLATWREELPADARGAVVLPCIAGEGPHTPAEVLPCVAAAVRAIAESGTGTPPRLVLVTESAAAVGPDEPGDPDGASLQGLVRVLALEHPELRPCLVDLDGSPGAPDDLVRELATPAGADVVAWRAGERYLARLARAEVAAPAAGAIVRPFARPDGAYVLTGGLGGLGLAVAHRLAEQGAGRLVLNARRPPGTSARRSVAAIRRLGTEVAVVLGDIAEPGVAENLVGQAVRHGHPLRGVAHAAGVLRDELVTRLTAEAVTAVLRPKVEGTRRLAEATSDQELDWWLAFGSAAALLGSPGQAAYATANAWLDALVHTMRGRRGIGTSIAWGPWTGTGGAPDMGALAVDSLAVDEGLDALQTVVAADRAHTGVIRLDAGRVAAALPGIEEIAYFAAVLGPSATSRPGGGGDGDSRLDLGALDRDSAVAAVRQRVLEQAAAVTGLDEIETTVPLTELGLDSLMAVRMRNALNRDFGTVLPQKLLLRGATLDDLVAAVHAAVVPEPQSAAAAPGPAAPTTVLTPATPTGTSATGPVTPDARPAPGRAHDAGVAPHRDQGAAPAAGGAARSGGPDLPESVLPRDAAERLVLVAWTLATGESVAGVDRELPKLRTDPELRAAFAGHIRDRLDGDPAAPGADQLADRTTLAAVADLVRPVLEGEDGRAPTRGLVRVLRDPGPGAGGPPLFVFHPAGGTTSVYRPLAALLPPDRPVIGLDRTEEHRTVEEKAERYLVEIRRIQPEGPYHLLGWSFGGCLAYEAAVRLRESGARVGYLGLVDTILPAALPEAPTPEFLLQRFARFAQYIRSAYGRTLQLPYQEMARMDEDGQVETLMRHLADAGLGMSPGVLEHQRTSYIDARAGERYDPRPYPDPVVLYRAREIQALTTAIDPRYLREDADLGWAPLCPRLEVVHVDGDHLSLIDPPHVDVIARHLRNAFDRR